MKPNNEIAGQFAEFLVNPDYRHAVNSGFEQYPDSYTEHRELAQTLLINSLYVVGSDKQKIWNLRYRAALAQSRGEELGAFSDFIHTQGGESAPSDQEAKDLGDGTPEVVRTNGKILGLLNLYDEPIDFMESALAVIDTRKTQVRHSVGPENYATALKFFTDKYQDFPSSHLDKSQIKQLVDQAMVGFLGIAKRDKPNFVEMTNLYVAMRTLPRDSFDVRFSNDIVLHSLEQLPTFNSGTIPVMVAALGKLDLSVTGENAANLIDLALRQTAGLQRTTNMNHALRTISGLPATSAANRAFATFLEVRNNLENPQDLEGLDAVNNSLAQIAERVVRDEELLKEAKKLAHMCALNAIRLYRAKESAGEATSAELDRLRLTLQRIVYHYNFI